MQQQGLTDQQKQQIADQLVQRAKNDKTLQNEIRADINKYRSENQWIKERAQDKTYKTAIKTLAEPDLQKYIKILQEPEEFKQTVNKQSLMQKVLQLPNTASKFIKNTITPKPVTAKIKPQQREPESEKTAMNKIQTRQLQEESKSIMSPKGSIRTILPPKQQQKLNISQGSVQSVKSGQKLIQQNRLNKSQTQNQYQSLNQSTVSSKSQKVASEKLFEKLAYDQEIRIKIPTLQLIQQQLKSGVITKQEANHSISENIQNAMRSNQSVQQVVHQKIQQLISAEQNPNTQQLQKSLYGQFDIDDATNNAKRSETNSVSGQTSQVSKQNNQVVFVDGLVQDNSKKMVVQYLEAVVNKSGDSVAGKKASQLLERIEKSQIQSDISQFVSQNPQQKQEQELDVGQNQMQDFPEGALKVSNLIDLVGDEEYIKLINEWSSRLDMTNDQQELASRVLYDIDDLREACADFDNISSIDDDKSVQSQSQNQWGSFVGDKQFGQSQKSQNYSQYKGTKGQRSDNSKYQQLDQNSYSSRSKFNQSDDRLMSKYNSEMTNKIQHELTINNGDHNQQGIFQDQDAKGNQISIDKILKVAENLLEKISKISGDITTATTYKDIKTQVQVFGTQIHQKEANNFKIQQGSLFALRSCC